MKVALVTGASSGIGLETARGLAERGLRVIAVGRNPRRTASAVESIVESTGNDSVETLLADFSSLSEVLRLADEVRERVDVLDVLVNNAGLYHPKRQTSRDGYEDTVAVNHLAPFLLTRRLLDLVEAAPAGRVVNVSSRLHEKEKRLDLDDLMSERRYSGMGAYRQTKLMNVLFSNELARRLERATSNSLHPGEVATNVLRNHAIGRIAIRIGSLFLATPKQGAQTSIWAATAPELEGVTGRYFRDCRQAAANPLASDPDLARRLWEVSESLVAL